MRVVRAVALFVAAAASGAVASLVFKTLADFVGATAMAVAIGVSFVVFAPWRSGQ